MLISVIISTYNKPAWLEKVIWGYVCQDDQDFELVIADDGSGPETRRVVDAFRQRMKHPIQHVWQEDQGFRKSVILNKATVAAAGEYLIFTDGDCIPRRDFVALHRRYAQPGMYLSGGYFKLPMSTSEQIDQDAIENQLAFKAPWLWRRGLKKSLKNLRLLASPSLRLALDRWIPTKATWNGNNSSAFKEAILKVNGYDERMAYGGQDVEMGYRLRHIGLQPRRIRYRALVMHLDHGRGYASEESIRKNAQIRAETLEHKLCWTDYGIEKR